MGATEDGADGIASLDFDNSEGPGIEGKGAVDSSMDDEGRPDVMLLMRWWANRNQRAIKYAARKH